MSDRGKEARGDTIGSQAAFDRSMWAVGVAIDVLEGQLRKMRADDGIDVTGISFRIAVGGTEEHLATVRAKTEEGHVVAFHSAYTIAELMRGLSARVTNRTLKWRRDEYRN
jgi:hypothetical protein